MAGSIGSVVSFNSASTGASTSLTIATPSHNAGDVLVYILTRSGGTLVNAPSDVDLAVGGVATSSSPTDWWYMRVGTGSSNEPASRSWTFSAARYQAAACVVIHGVVYPNGLLSAQSSTYNDTPGISVPSSTTTNSFALALITGTRAAFPADGRSDTAVVAVDSGGTANISSFDLQSAQVPTVGSTPLMSWDLAGSNNFNVGMTVVVFRSAGSDTRPVITTVASTPVTTPGATVTLTATASDPDAGDRIASYRWALAPDTADASLIIIASPNAAVTTVSLPNYEAAFTFICTVTDTYGIATSSTVSVCMLQAAAAGTGGVLYVKSTNGSLIRIS